MPITIPENRTIPLEAKAGGGFQSVGVGGGGSGGSGDITWTGSTSHGGAITVTDAQSRFGTRTNVKPIYVNTGAGKADTSLGRDTANRFPAASIHQTSIKNGSVAGAVGLDHFNNSTDAAFDGVVIDPTKPLIAYTERYYAFDISDPAYQGAQGFNLKPFRIWADTSPNNVYYGYQGADGQNSCRYFVEHVQSISDSYVAPQVDFAWFDEEIIFQNSSVDTEDGIYEHYRSNQGPLNDVLTPETVESGQDPLTEVNLDQVSNNTGQSSITYIGYICWDDEYLGVYLGNASTRGACTKLVRQPQTSWTAGEIAFQAVESFVTVSGAYMYFRTGKDTWISTDGVLL